MTAAAYPQLMSLAQWRALPEESRHRVELQEGLQIVSPRPSPAHSRAVSRLWRQLSDQLPPGFEALQEVEVVVDAATPATVRVPDVIVRRTDADDTPITADQVILAVEVVSPGSRRTDHVTKRSEYADAGVAHYWVVDLDAPPTITVLTLTPEGYDGQQRLAPLEVATPWELTVTL